MDAGAYTFKDARDFVAREIRGGADPDADIVKLRVNQAVLGCLQRKWAKGSFNVWTVKVHQASGELLLPPEIESAEKVLACSTPLPVASQWFRFMHRMEDLDGSCGNLRPLEVRDMGDGWIHDQTLCEAQRILAMVERPYGTAVAERAGLAIHIQGIGADDRPVTDAEGQLGFALPLQDTYPTYSDLEHKAVCVKQITAIVKPETRWPVVLYGYKDIQSQAELQAGGRPTLTQIVRLMPYETTVSRRKYKFTSGYELPETVEVLGRMRFRTLKYDNEILPVQDLIAIRDYVMALESESKGELQEAMYHHGKADRDLDDSLGKHLGTTLEHAPLPVVKDSSFGYGDIRGLGELYPRRHP